MSALRTRRLYLCEQGHLSSSVEAMAGRGDGPPFECHYPCMAPIVADCEMDPIIERMRDFGTKQDQKAVKVLRGVRT